MYEVLPGILEDSWEEIEQKIQKVAPFVKKIHIDLVDETFADKKNFFDPSPFAAYTRDTFFELHMMVKEPELYLEEWGAVGFRRFIGHVEQMSDQTSFVARCQDLGEVGLALDIDTPVEAIAVDLSDLDNVLVMMCKAGSSGQKFQPGALDKVRKLIQMEELLPITVDGGITEKTIQDSFSAGAARFVSTSFLFWGDEDPKARYQLLTRAIELSQEK